MNLIQPTITPGESGPHVSNLQAALLFLIEHDVYRTLIPPDRPTAEDLASLKQMLRAEQLTGQFGGATYQLLSIFQRQQGLGDHLEGKVEETTAKKLNAFLKQLGALDGDRMFAVKGHVLRAGIVQPDVLVRVFAADAVGETALGKAQTDNSGTYRIEFLASLVHASPGGAATDKGIVARAYRPDGSEMGAAQWAGAVEALMVLDVVVEPDEYVVIGTVTDQAGKPMRGLKVVAYDQDLRYRQRLGDATTEADGRYAIRYRREQFDQGEGQQPFAPDLVVEVLPDDNLAPLATSDRRHHAKPVEVIDLTVPAREPGPSEFERITAAVLPLLAGQGKEIQDDAGPIRRENLPPYELRADDIEFLVAETGLDAGAIQAWAESARWQQEALRLLGADAQSDHVAVIKAHGWPFFFAWIRAGQLPGLMGVLRSETQAWFQVQRKGEALNRVPLVIEKDWELLVSVLKELAKVAAVDDTLNSGDPLVEMLRQSPHALSRKLRLEVLGIYRAEGLGDPEAFLKLADMHPTAATELRAFVRTLRLNDLTDGQAPLIGALNTRLSDGGDSIHPLATLGAEDWSSLVRGAVDLGLAVEPSAYVSIAAGLQVRVEQLYPLLALNARLRDGSVTFADRELDGLRGVLEQHPRGADVLLRGKDLDSPAVKAIDNRKAIDTLLNIGRFGRLGLGFEGAADLYSKGISTPGQLLRFGPDHIRNMLLDKYPQDIANAFANNVTNAVANITSIVATVTPVYPGFFAAGGVAPARPPAVQQITAPTVRGMFGVLDECMCRPCESVLGLPAYLVDLLNLLDKASATGGTTRTALDLLKARRPALLTMPLSCENAETEVLHIDLALEVLEDAVPASAGTGATAAARAADALQRATFPWTLPFNAADTDLASCMERMGTTQHDLMSLVVTPTVSARANATLGVSGVERGLIAGQPSANWWELWGFASNASVPIDDPASNEAISGAPLELLERASVLMARTGLNLDALETALATDFVGGLAFNDRWQCKTSKMRLPQQTTPAAFDRLHRFTRLHRRLPDWNAAVLDSALKHLNATPAPNPLLLDDDVLNGIAQVKRAAEVLHLPVEVVLGLRAWPGETRVSLNLADRTKDETLFDRVFSRKRQVDHQRFAAVKRPGTTLPDSIASAAGAIAAAIGMDPRIVAMHAAAAGITISHESLTWLYRHHTLSRALGLTIDQLLRLMQVTGIKPFLLPAITVSDKAQGFAALSALAQASKQIADSGLPFDVAMALLQPDAPAAELPPGLRTTKQIDDWLEALKRALQAVPEPADLIVEAAQLYDPIKSLLSPLFKEDVVQAVMAELVSPSGNPDKKVIEALTSRLDHAALPDRSRLISKDEANLLLTPDSAGRWGKNERYAFVYERLLEYKGDVLRRVEAALATLLPSGQVKQIMDALHDATSPSRVDAFRALTTPAVAGKTFGVGRAVFVDQLAAETLLSSPPQPPQTLIPRYREVLDNIAAMQREQVLLDAVVGWTGWPEASLAPFLAERLTIEPSAAGQARLAYNFYLAPAFWSASAPPLPSDDAAAAKRWPRRLDRLTVLFNRSDAASTWQALPGLDWRDLIEPDVASAPAWPARAGLLDLLWLARPENISLNVLVEHFKRVSLATASLPDALTSLAVRLKSRPSDVHDLAKIARTEPALTTALTAANLTKPHILRATFELAMHARHLKAMAAQIATLVGNDPIAAARVARQLLAAQVGTDAWPTRIQPVDDALRMQRRDALVAWLLQHDTVVAPTQNRKPWTHSGQIYEHYLIDPEVQPCMRTTRILQGVAAVQLFVQRILFGLEKEVRDSSLLRERWTWMRSYRLWEANRKVFLYPENWLFPELRDNKSSSFKQLEAALGQGELTADLANQSFGQFLDDVAQLGQMQVVGMFEDVAWDNPTLLAMRKGRARRERTRRDLYMVGRTPNPPYRYFWRKCVDFGKRWMEWSPWQAIELDIQGDHVLPFVMANRLCLTWMVIRPVSNSGTPVEQDKWEITPHLSRFDGARWSRPEVVRVDSRTQPAAIEIARVPFHDDRSGFSFRCFVSPARLDVTIVAYAASPLKGASNTVPPENEPKAQAVTSPANLQSAAGRDELARLIKENVGGLPSKYANLFNAYCLQQTAKHRFANEVNDKDNLGPTYVDLVLGSPFYGLLNIYGDPDAESKHLEHMEAPVGITPKDLREKLAKVKDHPARVALLVDEFVTLFAGSGWYPFYTQYMDFARAILAVSSSHRVSYKVWLRFKSSGTEGVYELPANGGSFEIIEGNRTYAVGPGQTAFSLGTRLGPSSARTIKLRWDGHLSEPVTLVALDAGTEQLREVHFVIDLVGPPASYIPGFSTTTFSEVARFVIPPTGQARVLTGDSRTVLPNPVKGSEVWMNGFIEPEEQPLIESWDPTNNSGLSLIEQAETIEVFPTSTADLRYWIVGAGGGDGSSSHSDIWSFREGSAACIIDRAADLGAPQLYPNTRQDRAELMAQWSELRALPSQEHQLDDFGARTLPARSARFANAIPLDLQIGKQAFEANLPYACYNWEVFFHAPLLIANQFSRQQRFEEAERWIRFVFDPTSVSSSDPKAFLRFRVFYELKPGRTITEELRALAMAADGRATPTDVQTVRDLIERWRELPFRPFVVARRRHIAFLWRTLFTYLDNLIAWADSLYRRDTRESIGEATLLYVLAARILGPRPRVAGSPRTHSADSFENLRGKWDDFANVWVDTTPPRIFGWGTGGTRPGNDPPPPPEGFLHFCIPVNDKLLSYWNSVEERLFNIRHCRNIDGIAKDLPLLDPPIDPELLVRATAAGLDIGAVLSDLYAPPPHHRFSLLVARAAELASETRSLGAALLAALEKRDAEKLSLLRSGHEVNLHKFVKEVRILQIEEAKKHLAVLEATRKSTESRYRQYGRLMGKKDIRVPAIGETGSEDSMLGNPVEGLNAQLSGLGLTWQESEQYEALKAVNTWSIASGIAKVAAGGFHSAAAIVIPNTAAKAVGAHEVLGAIAHASSALGDAFSIGSSGWKNYADQQAMLANHTRRRDEWAFQSNQTLKELQQIDKQILASEIRIDIARKELENQTIQIEQAAAIDEYLRSKYTNAELYDWMVSQFSALHSSAYRMALDMARKAQKSAARELGLPALDLIRNDHWISLRSGLLAGERLHQDIKRLEISYLEQSRREYELTKHVSLRRLEPRALLDLVSTGACEFDIPEWLFDMDAPGHYMRRIKTVSVSIPCVVGPYTGVNCKLTLLKNETRHSSSSSGNYPRVTSGDDPRFTVRYGAAESIVTSTGRDDSGLFETVLRDERYLPFESAGVISTWRLELPGAPRQFDFDSISDVILHMRYTARDGGDSLRAAAERALATKLTSRTGPNGDPPGIPVLVSCKVDFPTEWARAKAGFNLDVRIDRSLLPYWMLKFKFANIERADIVKSQSDVPVFSTIIGLNLQGDKVELNLEQLDENVVDRLLLVWCTR